MLVALMVLGLAAATASWLYLGAPGLERAPGWFYQAVNKGSFDMLVVAGCAAAVPWLVRASFRLAGARPIGAAACIVLGSILLQLAAGLVARHQVRGWTERFFVGHGEFSWRAKDVPDALALLRNYESLAARNELGLYGPSKPPGTYAVYLLLDRSARWPPLEHALAPLTAIVARDPAVPPTHRTLFTWTILVLGLCTALTAVPLLGLARILFGSSAVVSARASTYPAWLFATAPVANVITVHLDGSVFPLLSAASTAFAALGAQLSASGRSAGPFAACAGGIAAMLAVYCSYGNLPILVMGLVIVLALWLQRRAGSPPSAGVLRGLAAPAAAWVTGAVLCLGVLWAVLEWQPVAGYLRGVGYHQRWRPNLPSIWRHGLAFLEFGLFAGPPLILAFATGGVLAAAGAIAAVGRAVRRRRWPDRPYGGWALALATVGLIAAISLALGTPEAARLWMYMLPWVCCAASLPFLRPALQPAAVALLTAQVVLVFFVKNYLVW